MKTEYQKCMDGEVFNGLDRELGEMTLRTKRLLQLFNSTDYGDEETRQALLRQIFGTLGKYVHVDIDFHCEYGKNIHTGDNVIINMNCTFVDNNRIDIGSNVLIASDVKMYTATHATDYAERIIEDFEQRGVGFCTVYAKPIRIEDGVWIGGGAVILPGVTIGARSIIGAGAVVTRDIPADSVAVGNPARVIKRINGK